MPELFEARNAKDEIINALKVKESAQVEILEALKAKREVEMASNNFSELFEQRNKCRDIVGENIGAIRELRTAFKETEDIWYKNDRLIRELKRQITKKSRALKAKQREEWIAKNGEDGEGGEGMPEGMEEDEVDENGEKPMDYDMAERIDKCSQLIMFLQKYQAKEAAPAEEAKSTAHLEGSRVKGMAGAGAMDDPLGLNAFMVDEAASFKKNKKNKKKAKAQAKKSNIPLEGEVLSLSLSLDMIQDFASMSLPTPIDTDDVASGIEGLTKKKEYYEEKAKTGMKLKELIQQEKAKRAKKGPVKKAPAEEKAPAEKASAAMEEVAAKEEANFQKSKAPEPAAEEKTELKRDFMAEKMARKVAEMPDVDPDIDLAAMRAKARAGAAGATDEEKKARGLLYDKSKASAVHESSGEEEDEGACDFDGGFDWDAEGGGEEDTGEDDAAMAAAEAAEAAAAAKAAKEKAREKERAAQESPKSPDPIEDKFEAYMKEQGLDEEDEEEDEEAPEFPPHVTPSGLKFQMKLSSDATVSFEITQLHIE